MEYKNDKGVNSFTQQITWRFIDGGKKGLGSGRKREKSRKGR